ncbi:MAG: gliding motility-associated C-terminal domain-containing protein [Prevotellaceae bacterium]|jgi:gliding motility-associated-like protein|nr:gliding motility-associated C-terminal domain-containing protein [Prevotellaceae bacterium]
MKQFYLFLITIILYISPSTLKAQTDNPVTLGGITTAGQLRIQIFTGGRYNVTRYTNIWQRQFFDQSTTPIFAIRIGTTTFSYKGHGALLPGNTLTAFNSIADIGTPITAGTQHEMTKKFTGTYSGNTFSVTMKITYDTSTPDYFIKHATVDATNIPAGTPISLAYGFDTYLGNNDQGYAYILPDIFSLNDNSTGANRYLTTAQVQSLRLVGASNNIGGGVVIGFFPIGRNFDRAFSAKPFSNGYSYNIVLLNPGNGSSSGADTQYKFRFGPFDGPFGNYNTEDNAQGVAYDNIPAGKITEFKTGLTFTPKFGGELDYYWNDVKNHTANIGDDVNLNMYYTSLTPLALDNVGFRVDFTGLQIRATGCTSSGFSGGTASCVTGNEFYQLSGASVDALGSATVSIPVNIVRAGQWVVDGSSISDMTETLPLGSPATLTVVTTVSLSDNAAMSVCKGSSQQFAVQFPSTITAANDVIVSLTYTGDIENFSSMPSSVTIPAGSNSATFTVSALPTGANNSAITIILSSTNRAFVTVAEPSSVTLTIRPEPSLNSPLTASVCSGTALSYTATSTEPGTTFSWTRAAVSGIIPPTGSGTDANINEILINSTANPIEVTYVYTLTGGCTHTQNVVVTVNLPPVVGIEAVPPVVCYGETAMLIAMLEDNTEPMIYTWYEGSNQTSTTTVNNFPLGALTATANYSVSVLNEHGCSETSTVTSITIKNVPSITGFSIPDPICAGNSLALPNPSFDLNNGTYTGGGTWTLVGTVITAASTLNYGDHGKELIYWIDNECGSSSYSPGTITVNQLPVTTISALPRPVCFGDASILTATVLPDGLTSDMSYTWLKNNTSMDITAENTYGLSALTATANYAVFVRNSNGCTFTSSPLTLTVNSLPVLTTVDANICSDETFTVSAYSNDYRDILRWYHDPLYEYPIVSASSSFTAGPLDSNTTFYLKATSLYGCLSYDSLTISITLPPQVRAMPDQRICYGDEIMLTTIVADGAISWNVSQTIVRPTVTTEYIVTASRPPCPTVRDTVRITVGDLLYIEPAVLPDFQRNKFYEQQLHTNAVPSQYFIVSGQLPGGMIFNSNGTISGVSSFNQYKEEIYTFTVQVIDGFSCSIFKTYTLHGDLFIPVVFSPNNDGINDYFMKGYKVVIYDRLGVKIFKGNDGWDGTYKGKEAPIDTYFYVLFYRDVDERELKKSGSITLLK